jgi:anti-anti-sigma factor
MQLFSTRRKKRSEAPAVGRWLKELKSQALDCPDGEIVVDLSAVEQINSGELGELAKIHLFLRQHDRRLILANVQDLVFEVFELTRMNRLIDVRHPHIV